MSRPTTAAPRLRAGDLALLAALGFLVVAVHGQFVPDHVYGYDEADYRSAADARLRDHWADRPSIPLAEFMGQGRESLSREASTISRSEFVRSAGDLPFLRHYHGPLYWYGLVPAARWAGSDEAALRRSGLAWAVLLAWTLYVGSVGLGLGRLPALLASLFATFSPELIETFGLLNPHGPYVALCTVTLFLAAHAIRTGSRPAWWAAAAAVGLACATAAFSLLLAGALLLAAAVARSGDRPGGAAAWRAGLSRGVLALGILGLLWPGAFLKLTLLRGYAFYGYLALARPATYGQVGALEAWRTRLAFSPFEWGILLALLAAGGVAFWKRGADWRESIARNRWALPFVIYGGLLATTTLFITTPKARYTASLLPVLFLLACAVLARFLAAATVRVRIAAGLAIPCALALNLFLYDRAEPLAPDPANRLDDRVVQNLTSGPPDARLLLPRYYVPIAGCYLPGAELLGRDRPADLIAAASHWRPGTVAYMGPRDLALEIDLIVARGAEPTESITVSGGSRQVTILRFGSAVP